MPRLRQYLCVAQGADPYLISALSYQKAAIRYAQKLQLPSDVIVGVRGYPGGPIETYHIRLHYIATKSPEVPDM